MDGIDVLKAGLARDYAFLDAATIDRIARAYGTQARAWLGNAPDMAALGAHFGHGLTAAEVDYLRNREWARTAEDIVWRRTKLGLRLNASQMAQLKTYLGEAA